MVSQGAQCNVSGDLQRPEAFSQDGLPHDSIELLRANQRASRAAMGNQYVLMSPTASCKTLHNLLQKKKLLESRSNLELQHLSMDQNSNSGYISLSGLRSRPQTGNPASKKRILI
jgi:hypothetical protein